MSMKMVFTEQVNLAVVFSASSSSVARMKMCLIFMNIQSPNNRILLILNGRKITYDLNF